MTEVFRQSEPLNQKAEERMRGQGPTVPSDLRTSQQASCPNSAAISGITILGIKP